MMILQNQDMRMRSNSCNAISGFALSHIKLDEISELLLQISEYKIFT